jgi:hypothetical protein
LSGDHLAALFPNQASDCSAIHLTALASLEKPSILSTCPLGHVASTIYPTAGGVFLRAVKVGRGSLISHYSKTSYATGRKLFPPTHALPHLESGKLVRLIPNWYSDASSSISLSRHSGATAWRSASPEASDRSLRRVG